MARRIVLPSRLVTLSASGRGLFRGSMASLRDPLPTLRPGPHGTRRTARGRCDSLGLHRRGLAPHTPCRSPGALPEARGADRFTGRKAGALPRTPCGPLAFPSALALGSTRSLSRRRGSFADFTATMAGSDFSSPFIAGFGPLAFPARTRGAQHRRPATRSPGSRTRSVHACWGL